MDAREAQPFTVQLHTGYTGAAIKWAIRQWSIAALQDPAIQVEVGMSSDVLKRNAALFEGKKWNLEAVNVRCTDEYIEIADSVRLLDTVPLNGTGERTHVVLAEYLQGPFVTLLAYG